MAGEREYTAEDFRKFREILDEQGSTIPAKWKIAAEALRIAERVMMPGLLEQVLDRYNVPTGWTDAIRAALTKGGASD